MPMYPYMTVDEQPSSQLAYYRNQAGGSLPVYAGQPYQTGHGLGNVVSGIIKAGSPLLNALKRKAVSAIKTRGKKALLGVVGDVLRGRNIGTSLKRRAMGAIGISGRPIKKTKRAKRVSRSKRPVGRRTRGRRLAITAGPSKHIFS